MPKHTNLFKFNRRELPGDEGYSIYETVSEIIDSLAKVFPVFLYFVAVLVTLTTMTRFVGDERILLQPKSPKAGTKILLERIKPIWRKMKFPNLVRLINQKNGKIKN